jgi:hypothetical protein
VLASIALFLVMLLIHIATYRLFQGEILASGGNNEILSILLDIEFNIIILYFIDLYIQR